MDKILIFFAVVGFSEAALNWGISWDSECGVTKGCFPDCKDSGCKYLVTWQANYSPNTITFEIFVEETGSLWVGVGFSFDEEMGADSGVACLTTVNSVLSFYNTGYTSSFIASSTQGISSSSVYQSNGITKCSFTRQNDGYTLNQYYFHGGDYFLFVGSGPASYYSMQRHSSIPYISDGRVDFKSTQIVGRITVKPLIKLHAISMVLAWHLFSCIAIVIARYEREMMVGKKVWGNEIWFQLHRLLMILVAAFVLIGFIVIFKERGVLRLWKKDEVSHAAHPVLGIIVFGLTMINPIMGVFRPNKDHKQRETFNWVHRLVGMVAHILALTAIFLGFNQDRVEDVSAAKNATYAHIAMHASLMLILETIKWWIQFNDDKEKATAKVQRANEILMLIHAVAMMSTTLAVIVIVGKA